LLSIKQTLHAYIELTKPRLVSLVLWSVSVGYLMAVPHKIDFLDFLRTIFSVALVAAGSLVLNEWVERDYDALMKRTEKRPLPAGLVRPKHALVWGVLISILGLVLLFLFCNLLSFILTLLTWFSYLFVYTPLKRITILNTLVGALPGALPPMIGWTAVRGRLDLEAWVLFVILFLWQLPHFITLAWMFRKDYEKAGFVMISATDVDGRMTSKYLLIYSLLLIPVSFLPVIVGMTGMIYFVLIFILDIALIVVCISCVKDVQNKMRKLFLFLIFYLTVLLLGLVLGKA
jgi:protoheme IX farnesyltransferase